jgi:ribosome-binding protein aMBF1 (putative translation factor)
VVKATLDSEVVERIRHAIQESGRSLNELGKKARINHSQLSRFMRAERDLTLNAAGRLCEVLGLQLTQAETLGNSAKLAEKSHQPGPAPKKQGGSQRKVRDKKK